MEANKAVTESQLAPSPLKLRRKGMASPCAYRLLFSLFIALLALSHGAQAAEDVAGKGLFRGRVLVEWLDDDRTMRLHEPFTFIDSVGHTWEVPAGTIVDGASIPRVFWTSIGPPFVGPYRRASVIHDYFCEAKNRPWRDVHKMFFEASLAAGVPELKAKIMYAAVYGGGPRWEILRVEGFEGDELSDITVDYPPLLDEAALESAMSWVEKENPSPPEIEAFLTQAAEPR